MPQQPQDGYYKRKTSEDKKGHKLPFHDFSLKQVFKKLNVLDDVSTISREF